MAEIHLGDLPIENRCGKCGSSDLVVNDNPTDESIVTCKRCGAELGSWGELRKHTAEAAADELKKRLKNLLGDNFKPT